MGFLTSQSRKLKRTTLKLDQVEEDLHWKWSMQNKYWKVFETFDGLFFKQFLFFIYGWKYEVLIQKGGPLCKLIFVFKVDRWQTIKDSLLGRQHLGFLVFILENEMTKFSLASKLSLAFQKDALMCWLC